MKGQKGFVQVHPAPLQSFPIVSWAKGAVALMGRWVELARQRQQLASLDDGALKDLGLSRADIASESDRPFWDDPMKRG